MNVLFLTFTYPTPEVPQAGVFVVEHARAAARVANVAVVHLDRGAGQFALEDIGDAEFPTIRVHYPRSALAYPLHFVGAWLAVRRMRRRGFCPDVIHAHVFLAALPPLLLRPLFGNVPVVVTEQWSVFLPEDPATLSPLMLHAARRGLRRAARILPASDALRRGMEAVGVRGRFTVVPNVVDTSQFHPAERRSHDRTRAVFVGLLYEAKGLDLLLEAVALVEQERGGLDLVLVGDGPLADDLRDLARRRGIEHLVSFAGFLAKPAVAKILADADLFVLTSRYDNNPCALIEAQASGLPAVATRVGGIPEIVEDGGVLADPTPDSIARALLTMVESLDRFDRFALAERARTRYGVEAIATLLGRIYAEAHART